MRLLAVRSIAFTTVLLAPVNGAVVAQACRAPSPPSNADSVEAAYLPAGVLAPTEPSMDHWWRRSIGGTLRRFEEDRFWSGALPRGLHFRAIWRRSFDPAVIVRIHLPDGARPYIVTKIAPEGESDVECAADTYSRALSPVQHRDLLALLGASDYWNLRHTDPPGYDSVAGTVTTRIDGATWILEGVRVAERGTYTYQFVNRWSPRPDDPFRQLMEHVLKAGAALPADTSKVY